MFRLIESEAFAPFAPLELEIPPLSSPVDGLAEVHLFTGINGTGKSRLLCLLAAMLGSHESLFSRGGVGAGSKQLKVVFSENVQGHRSDASIFQVGPQVGWSMQLGRVGQYVSGTPAFAYNGGAYLTDAQVTPLAATPRPPRGKCLQFERKPDDSAALVQTIANLKLQAAMESADHEAKPEDARSTRIVRGVEDAVAHITGRAFRFKLSSYKEIKLEVSWDGVNLGFRSLPDGLRSIIGFLVHAVAMVDSWLEGKEDPLQTHSVFLIDEIETHLHPAWQRKILPAFQKLFPKSQIFVSTHSPFVVSSLNRGWIHQMCLASDGKVTIAPPKEAGPGDSYIAVLEEIMGIKELYDQETESQLSEFRRLRDQAYKGDQQSIDEMLRMGAELAKGSTELSYLIGSEIAQFRRIKGFSSHEP